MLLVIAIVEGLALVFLLYITTWLIKEMPLDDAIATT
jgi:hypothetical protein